MKNSKLKHMSLENILCNIINDIDPKGKMYINTDNLIYLIATFDDYKDNLNQIRKQFQSALRKNIKDVLDNEIILCELSDTQEGKIKRIKKLIEILSQYNNILCDLLLKETN